MIRASHCLLLVLLLLAGLSGRPDAAVTERIVTNSHTGLAIDGFDPVAYFTDSAPIMGRAEFEYRYKGVIWRFDNEGNRAAFAKDTDQYMPRFGGYDSVAIARGVALAGNPSFWAIVHDRLYLFYSAEALASFKSDTDSAIGAAEAKWPSVMESLTQ
jgi:YHS domain-containing protein